MNPETFVVVFVTTSSVDEAERVARPLVEEGLAACVNIVGPMRSIYRWQGQVESAAEHLLIVKARAVAVAAVAARVRALHSYAVPEIIAVPIVAGSDPYLAWLEAATTGRA